MSYLTPMLLTVGVSVGNSWYNSGGQSIDIKALLAGGIATGLLGLLNNIPGMASVTTGIAWVAFVAIMVGPVQHPSPLDNLSTIVGVK
jgi:hypothetical protein